jgi:hypothetical protein
MAAETLVVIEFSVRMTSDRLICYTNCVSMATVLWCSTASILWRRDTWRTRGQYSYIPVYFYIYTKGGRDEIPTKKIALTKESLNLKHKMAYSVKTFSVHVWYVLHVTTKFLWNLTTTENPVKHKTQGRATLLHCQHNNTNCQSHQRLLTRCYQQHREMFCLWIKLQWQMWTEYEFTRLCVLHW